MHFKPTLEEISSRYYMLAASKRTPNMDKLNRAKENLLENYRILSEKAHGKYAYLQSTHSGSNNLIDDYVELACGSIKSLIVIGTIRSTDPEKTQKTIPALENYL
jgi:hypothetical protein